MRHDEAGCSHALAKKLGDVVSLNVTGIRGQVPGHECFDGFAVNCVPTEAIAAMDIRIPPHVPFEEIDNLLKDWTAEEGLQYGFYNKVPEHHVSSIEESNPWWHAIQEAFKSINKQIIPEIFPAATDSRYFRKTKLPCYGFSPINNTPILLHDHDEFLNDKVLIEGVKIFEHLVYSLANVESTE